MHIKSKILCTVCRRGFKCQVNGVKDNGERVSDILGKVGIGTVLYR